MELRKEMWSGHGAWRLAFALLLFGGLLLGQLSAWAQELDEAVLTPEAYRIKIDDVDVSKAPDIRISTTFLDRRGIPVSPQKIELIEVFHDEEALSVVPKLTTFKDGDIPLDMAIIVPISQRFSRKDLEAMKKSLTHILGQARKGDRVAGFFDDGQAIHVAPLDKADAIIELLSSMEAKAQPSFLYSSLDKAIEEMSDPAKLRNPARRAIILVTDAFDTYIFRANEVQREIQEAYKRARQHDIRIYVVMYRPFIRSLIPLFEGLSRKTGGTYRYADFTEQISSSIDYAWGEIYGQLQVEFRDPKLRSHEPVTYRLDVTREGGVVVKAENFREITVGKLKFNWKRFWIIMGIVAGVLLLSLIVFLILRRRRKKREAEAAARTEQEIAEKIERGEVCPKCRRSMLKDWTACMFCARELAEEQNKAIAEKRQKALEEAKEKGRKLEGRICPRCQRTMMPQWKDCLFCKAGIGSDDAKAKPGVAPMKEKTEKKAEKAQICKNCKREMKPHWTTCLYCEATAAPSAAAAAAKPKENPPSAAKLCPQCKRPMKAHWEICLYCEANRAR